MFFCKDMFQISERTSRYLATQYTKVSKMVKRFGKKLIKKFIFLVLIIGNLTLK